MAPDIEAVHRLLVDQKVRLTASYSWHHYHYWNLKSYYPLVCNATDMNGSSQVESCWEELCYFFLNNQTYNYNYW